MPPGLVAPPGRRRELARSTHGKTVFLSSADQRIAGALVEQYGRVVSERELQERSGGAGHREQTLRVNVSRLRRRIAPIGLEIACVRGHGYLLRDRGCE